MEYWSTTFASEAWCMVLHLSALRSLLTDVF
jgi:hypothetical protein